MPESDPKNRAALFREAAARRGFLHSGVASAGRAPHHDVFEAWLDAGRHGSLSYLARQRALRERPDRLLDGARSVVMLAAPHADAASAGPDGARVARYALSPDYHRTLYERCREIVADMAESAGPFRSRICVDSAPLPERDFAAAAGLGWIGKNGMLLNERSGSYLLLAAIVTDLELAPDAPVAERCGGCNACAHACPTGAIVAPRVVDARRCLSYWTIEQRGEIPEEIVAKIGGWVFGCDICQEVCPYNRRGGPGESGPAAPRPESLEGWLTMTAGAWRRRWRGTPLFRAGASGMKRNAAAAAQALRRRDLAPTIASLANAPHTVVARQAARAAAALSAADEP